VDALSTPRRYSSVKTATTDQCIITTNRHLTADATEIATAQAAAIIQTEDTTPVTAVATTHATAAAVADTVHTDTTMAAQDYASPTGGNWKTYL
jgi:hypothetical protein